MSAIPPHIAEQLDPLTRSMLLAWLPQVRVCPHCGGQLTTRDSETNDGLRTRRLRCKSGKETTNTYEEIKDAKLTDAG